MKVRVLYPTAVWPMVEGEPPAGSVIDVDDALGIGLCANNSVEKVEEAPKPRPQRAKRETATRKAPERAVAVEKEDDGG